MAKKDNKKESRFEVIHKEGSSFKSSGVFKILVDKETKVQYLLWTSGYGSSITPLLDENGKVIIKDENEDFLYK